MTTSPIIEALDQARIARGWTVYRFGKEAGLAPQTWQHIRASGGATIYTLNLFAEAVGLRLALVPARAVLPHGTRAAVRRHQYRHEPLCDVCRPVEAERKRRERAARSTPDGAAA